MRRDPLVESLIAQVDAALAELQEVRRIAVELRRSADALHRGIAQGLDDELAAAAPALRFSGMTVAEAAAKLNLGEEQVRRLLRRGLLSGVAFGGRTGWRLHRASVDAVARDWDSQRLAQAAARRKNPPSEPASKQPRR